MKIQAIFEVDLPELFVISRMQEFEFADEIITYRCLGKNDITGDIVYEKSIKKGATTVISAQETAKEYFLALQFGELENPPKES